MTGLGADLLTEFEAFCDRLSADELQNTVATDAGVSPDWLAARLRTSLAEARHTLRFVAPELRAGQRILEIGAGLGLTSGFLARVEHDVTSIEPGGEGFEDYRRTNPAIRRALGVVHPHHEMDVEEVEAARLGGRFDLVFSNNVLEHVAQPHLALERLDAVLAPGGVMIHN